MVKTLVSPINTEILGYLRCKCCIKNFFVSLNFHCCCYGLHI